LKKCPENHPLIPIQGRIYDLTDGYKQDYYQNCDICEASSIHLRGLYYHCLTCKYDVCMNCYIKKYGKD